MSNVSTVGHVQNRLEMQCFVVVLAQTCPNNFMYQYKSTMSCCEAIRSSWRCLSFAHPDLCNDKEVVRIALRCLTSPRIWVWGNCGEIGEITLWLLQPIGRFVVVPRFLGRCFSWNRDIEKRQAKLACHGPSTSVRAAAEGFGGGSSAAWCLAGAESRDWMKMLFILHRHR